jgi:hypothetical protein
LESKQALGSRLRARDSVTFQLVFSHNKLT